MCNVRNTQISRAKSQPPSTQVIVAGTLVTCLDNSSVQKVAVSAMDRVTHDGNDLDRVIHLRHALRDKRAVKVIRRLFVSHFVSVGIRHLIEVPVESHPPVCRSVEEVLLAGRVPQFWMIVHEDLERAGTTLLRTDNYHLRKAFLRDFSSVRYLASTVVSALIEF